MTHWVEFFGDVVLPVLEALLPHMCGDNRKETEAPKLDTYSRPKTKSLRPWRDLDTRRRKK